MGRKFDINKARTSNNNMKKSNHNFYHNYNNTENISQSENEINSNQVSSSSTYYRDYDLPQSADLTIKFQIKPPVVLIILIVAIILMLLMVFIVIFYDESSFSSGRLYALGQTCETVTVTDTENYIYDGDVSFDDYIAGVVAAESDGSTNLEYLKLLAINARTYFFENASSSCTVKGNSKFQKYMDVEDSENSELVKQAIESTKDLVITQGDALLEIDYSSGCVVNDDSTYFYIRYIETASGETKYQQIPKSWARENGVYTELNNLYQSVDKNETNYQNRSCPDNTTDAGMSKIGALYLITSENYSYQEVIEYYNGTDTEIIKNEITHQGTGNGGFINPTSSIYCSSAYGYRTHPVSGESSFHTGLDIGAGDGSPIYAAKDGIITRVEKNVTAINNCNYGYGNYIMIDHGDDSSTLYAHMKYGSIPDSISEGTTVTQGEQIGQVGSTGCSTGNHLHYEVLISGSTVDPADYLDLTNASGTCKR